MYKVFFKDRIISLTDDKYLRDSDEYTFSFKNYEQLKCIVSEFLNASSDYVLIHSNLDELWDAFKDCFEVRYAAGGIVIKDDSFLAIKRWGKWDLPKGHIEHGETAEYAAIREVEEETNISSPQIVKQLPSTFHIYKYSEKFVLKVSYWYEMKYNQDEELIPQIEEDITEVIWLPKKNKSIFTENTYPSLFKIINIL